jgi:hypothetical protein
MHGKDVKYIKNVIRKYYVKSHLGRPRYKGVDISKRDLVDIGCVVTGFI